MQTRSEPPRRPAAHAACFAVRPAAGSRSIRETDSGILAELTDLRRR